MRFKSYMSNLLLEKNLNLSKLELTVLEPHNPLYKYCYVNVSTDVANLPKGYYRLYGKESGGIPVDLGKGISFKLVEIVGINDKVRTEGKSYQVTIPRADLEYSGKSKGPISRIAVSNNAEALERTVIIAAEWFFKNKRNITPEEMKEIMDNQPDARAGAGYRVDIYNNAIKSSEEVHHIISPSKTYHFERQKENYSKKLYQLAGKYNKLGPGDNWNPADIWLFSTAGVKALQNIDSFIENYVENLKIPFKLFEAGDDNERSLALNFFIAQGIQSKDIIPISLKKPTNPKKIKTYLLNNFDPANLPATRNVGDLEVTNFTYGTDYFSSFEIQTNHPDKLAIKMDLKKPCYWQHRVRNNSAGHAEGSYDSTTEWKRYLRKPPTGGAIEIYGCQGDYKAIPTSKAAMKKLFDEMYKVMKNNSRYQKKAFNKIGDPDVWFERNYEAGSQGTSKSDVKKPGIEMIKRLIFTGSWQKAITQHPEGDNIIKKAISIAIKTDHNQAGGGPHYIIK